MPARTQVISAPHRDSLSRIRSRANRFGRKFARDEDGALLVFGVYVFLLILMVGGIGIDMMRFERDRSELQYTLDRAVLAAADLDQVLEPEAVVQDYMDKAGLSQYLTSVTVDQGIAFRDVIATAEAEVTTQFMHMGGIDALDAPAASRAEERIGSVEISLILDVSGSMNSNSRLVNLKIAAKDFVDQMFDNTEEDKLSISIIPYATQVSLPQEMFNEFNIQSVQNFSRCVNFTSSAFDTPAISTVDPLTGTMHFTPWNTTDFRDNDPIEYIGQKGENNYTPVCEARDDREILPFSKSRTELKNFIDDFTARGNTSIDIGMKWGAAMLDPAFQPVVSNLVDGGHVDSAFSARPSAYTDGDTLKVVVLMTDGQNTSQYYIDSDYRTGNSDVWWNEAEEEYSIYDEDTGLYYWKNYDDYRTSKWHDHPFGNGTYERCNYNYYSSSGNCYGSTTTKTEPGSAEHLSYGDLFAYSTLKWVRYNLMDYVTNDHTWFYDVREYVNSTIKDNRTEDICNAAKANDVIVYTIGFEAPTRGQNVLKDCASSDSHFFDAVGRDEIVDAFSSIASSISKLRLTQ